MEEFKDNQNKFDEGYNVFRPRIKLGTSLSNNIKIIFNFFYKDKDGYGQLKDISFIVNVLNNNDIFQYITNKNFIREHKSEIIDWFVSVTNKYEFLLNADYPEYNNLLKRLRIY